MPINPFEVICEILGEPAHLMTNPANAGYQCPFINSTCVKRSQNYRGIPYPVCSIFRSNRRKETQVKEPIIVCPKRFYAGDLFHDILKYAWTGTPPQNPQFVREIKMARVGTVDFVVADVDTEAGNIRNFVSAELQAIDITGSVEPAYAAITLSQPLERKFSYGFNYANVRKRFVTQLINKGFFHHQWQTKIVAVLQRPIYENIQQAVRFADTAIRESNVLFLQYDLAEDQGRESHQYTLRYSGIAGTTHSELMMHALYSNAPPKEDFCRRILAQIRSGSGKK